MFLCFYVFNLFGSWRQLAAGTYRLPYVSSYRPIIGLGPLPSDRQPFGVAEPSPATHLFQPLNGHHPFPTQVALNFVVFFNYVF